MTPKRQKLISWGVCLLVPVLMMIYALIAHPDGLYAAPGQYVINVLAAILVPVLYVLPYLLWIASAIAVGVIIYKAKQILVPGSAWKAVACGMVSGLVSFVFLHDVVALSHEDGIGTNIIASILLLLPVFLYPVSHAFVCMIEDKQKRQRAFGITLLLVLSVFLLLILGAVRDAQSVFDEWNKREAAFASATLNEGDDPARAAAVDDQLFGSIRLNPDSAALNTWIMREGLIAPKVMDSVHPDGLSVMIPAEVAGKPFVEIACWRHPETQKVLSSILNLDVKWLTDKMAHRLCVKRAAEF